MKYGLQKMDGQRLHLNQAQGGGLRSMGTQKEQRQCRTLSVPRDSAEQRPRKPDTSNHTREQRPLPGDEQPLTPVPGWFFTDVTAPMSFIPCTPAPPPPHLSHSPPPSTFGMLAWAIPTPLFCAKFLGVFLSHVISSTSILVRLAG